MKFCKYSTGDSVMRHKTIDKSQFLGSENIWSKIYREAVDCLQIYFTTNQKHWADYATIGT